ncbi:hypothetical protein FJQ55_05555 [Rhizobium glycinendophyticum]|uniref:Uncharacterized protein n=1 Tax=Rhizobium glycinendophyticum TaxID=2589807 RepID=A0A504U5P4_9HYPH|nr:hypothetical protein FJQ55_05555 [Rhizobium glycinendophyticum]
MTASTGSSAGGADVGRLPRFSVSWVLVEAFWLFAAFWLLPVRVSSASVRILLLRLAPWLLAD